MISLKAPTLVYGLYINLKGYESGYRRRADGQFELANHYYMNYLKSIKGTTPWKKSESFLMESGNYAIPFSFSFPLYGDNGEQLQVINQINKVKKLQKPTFSSAGRHKVTYLVRVCLSFKNWFSDLSEETKLLVLGRKRVLMCVEKVRALRFST